MIKKVINLRKIILTLLMLILIFPSINLVSFGTDGSYIKSTNMISAVLGFFLIVFLFRSIQKETNFKLIMLLLTMVILYIQKYPVLAFIYTFQLASIILIPYFFASLNKKIDFSYVFRLLIYIAIFNIFISVVSRMFDYQIIINSSALINKYGLLYGPYIYSVYIGAALIINFYIKKINYLSYLYSFIMVIALMYSDSRSIGWLFIGFYAFLLLKNNFKNIIPVMGLLLYSINFLTNKMSLDNITHVTTDPSVGMRLVNYDNYIEWATFDRVLFGGGFRSFLEFSTQYGSPGPIDNLFLRLVAETGFLGFTLFLVFNYIVIKKSYQFFSCSGVIHRRRYNLKLEITGLIAIFVGIGLFHESLLVPRSGHMMYMLFVVIFYAMRVPSKAKVIKHAQDGS